MIMISMQQGLIVGGMLVLYLLAVGLFDKFIFLFFRNR